MKIDARRAHIQQALQKSLEKGLETGLGKGLEKGLDATRLRQLIADTGATPAEVRDVLQSLGDAFGTESRKTAERLLSMESGRASSTAPSVEPGRRLHDVRALRSQPWWSGVEASLPAPLFPEPPRDVDVHGERFSKDDVASLLRGLARG